MLTGAPRLVSTDPPRLEPPERSAPVEDRERVRWLGPIGSLIVHLLPLLLLLEWPTAAPPEITPIAVQLVIEPPSPEPPLKPVPPPPQFKPPPPGRIASEDMGDTEAKEVGRAAGDAPAAKDIPPPEVRPSATSNSLRSGMSMAATAKLKAPDVTRKGIRGSADSYEPGRATRMLVTV